MSARCSLLFLTVHVFSTRILTFDERRYEKIHSELPLIDAKIKDFEKLHEDVRKNVSLISPFFVSLFLQAKDKIDEAQQRLKRIRDQQSISLEGSGTMTWNDWFM